MSEITNEIIIETNLYLEFLFWTVDNPYTITKDMPSINKVARKVAIIRRIDSHSPNPIFPQLISYG